MPPPSVFHQGVNVTAVPAWSLFPSPRNYNSSIIEFDGRRLMAYRSHRLDQHGRCSIAMCELNAKWEAAHNCWLDLPEQIASVMVHHEDPRLFVFKGRLHVAFTGSQFHAPPRPYTCTMKYARLRKVGHGWEVERLFWPRHGFNDGSHQEKNWQFFEAEKGRLFVIYQAEPHVVLELGRDGESVVNVTRSEGGVKWPWGTVRGGTPPIQMPDGKWLTFFHSATPYPTPPFWRRYYAGAYVFEPEPPFRITAISQRPLLTGSEADGHGHDPRNIDSWKPFVVFPCGAIPTIPKPAKKNLPQPPAWWVSYGINDHMTAVAEHTELLLGDPAFAQWPTKYFWSENGSAIIKVFVVEDRPPTFVKWQRTRQIIAGQSAGVLAVKDPKLALQLAEMGDGVKEISPEEYAALKA